jgi:hypothetical protein
MEANWPLRFSRGAEGRGDNELVLVEDTIEMLVGTKVTIETVSMRQVTRPNQKLPKSKKVETNKRGNSEETEL